MKLALLVIAFALITNVIAQDLRSFNSIKSELKELNRELSEGETSDHIDQFLLPSAVTTATGSISGRVLDTNGKKLFLPASVRIYNEFGYPVNNISVNNYGQYKFENLPPGKYTLQASCGKCKSQFYDKAEKIQQAKWVSVENIDVTDIDFYLDKYMGSISGFLKDINNNPIVRCYVFISGSWGGYASSTDSSGKYVFSNLPPGKYKIYVQSLTAGNYLSQWYSNAETEEDAEPIDVFENTETQNINFVLPPGAVITGKLVLSNYWGEYYPYSINLYRDGISLYTKFPDSHGNFSFSGIAKGNYKLQYSCRVCEDLLTGWYPDSFTEEDALTLSITPPDTIRNINIVMAKGGWITGTLLNPSAHAESYDVFILDKDNKKYTDYSFLFDQYHKSYKIGKIPSGKYKLRINQQNYAEEWYNNKNNREEADWITVTAPDTVKEINFSYDPGCSIGGVIYDPSAMPLTKPCTVFCYNLSSELYQSAYTENGKYEIKGLRMGDKVVLSVSSHEKNNFAQEFYNNKYNFSDSDTIIISGQLLNIDFQLSYKGIIQGFINDSAGNNGSAQDMLYNLFDAETGDHITSDFITYNGGYYFSPVLGKYKMSFLSSDPSDSIAVTYYGGGNSFDDPSSSVINLNDTEPVTLNEQNLETAAGSISGNITDKDTSNPNKSIFIYDDKGFLVKRAFTTEASYKITGLRPGIYYIGGYFGYKKLWYKDVRINSQYVFSPKTKIPANAVSVTVGNGETAGINFQIGDVSEIGKEDIKTFSFQLEQNFPNPFNPETKITYHIPEQSRVRIKIYNILGSEIETLVDQEQYPGSYTIKWNASHLSSGIYFYTLQSGEQFTSKKLILVK